MQVAEKKKLLLKYVKEVQPALIEQFVDQGPPAVVAAMRNTITNMVRPVVLQTRHQLLTGSSRSPCPLQEQCCVCLVLL
jgi:hypothetical protein